ncbi:hypothetical protein CQW23_30360 [Capsicum baccatum]|uniref:Uncharacterized protein n=2 Tax=Capsicum TaxID=4071 RepID=A0A2G2ZBT9_CAPAN|nr:putative G-type lectin S-receptor-like serine/threonine-protein kinase-like [Capsicum annuum]KAF3641247.1 putative G-type lectin S-receptor-like serine/threonine-protein kinase-like [Capsicum annuum]PHT30055.1 hypothetical protein CQW23_30360 [Capsicum baccatum]PHT79414.1 hypothetical protein T459_17466 [Capsicum annuum]
MDAGEWRDSEYENVCFHRCYSGREYNRLGSYKLPANKSCTASIWRLIWKKIKKEKKKIFDCSNSMRFSYDPHSYSKNFDQGSILRDDDDDDEPSRSFSARFAVPSRILIQDELIMCIQR